MLVLPPYPLCPHRYPVMESPHSMGVLDNNHSSRCLPKYLAFNPLNMFYTIARSCEVWLLLVCQA